MKYLLSEKEIHKMKKDAEATGYTNGLREGSYKNSDKLRQREQALASLLVLIARGDIKLNMDMESGMEVSVSAPAGMLAIAQPARITYDKETDTTTYTIGRS